MNNSNMTYKIKLGIFIFTGAVLFVFGLYYIGNRQKLFGNTFRISAFFEDVKGLQVGNNVRLSGINVGIIENMEQISDTAVRVDFLIEEKVRKFIKKNAKAVIGTEGMMGNKIMLITPGNGNEAGIKSNDVIGTSQPVSVDDIIQKLKITSDNAANITGDLALVMENITNGKGTVGMLFMDTVFALNLFHAIVNIKRGSHEFEKNMDAAGKSFLLRRFLKGEKNKKNGEGRAHADNIRENMKETNSIGKEKKEGRKENGKRRGEKQVER